MASSRMDAASKIVFNVSCKGLKRSDVLSKSDPFAVISSGRKKADGRIDYTEIGRTETIGNTSDPEWTRQVAVDFFFNEIQNLKVNVYDDDTVTNDDGLGGASFTLGALVAAPGMTLSVRLNHRSGRLAKGVLIVRGEELSSCTDRVKLTMRGIDLKNKDGLFGKSDPYFTVSRMREDEHWQQVYRSPVVMNNLNPLWDTVEVPVQVLCNGDYGRSLRVEVWDWDKDGDHDFMGLVNTNLQELLEGQGREMKMEHRKKGKKCKGSLRVERANLFQEPTLLQYIAGGLQINLMVAIDFTGSNGHPMHPDSLHHVDPSGELNQYQRAIVSIGTILQDYDSDKMFPVYGFGGRLKGAPVSHCFLIYDRYNADGEAYGVNGVLEAYSASLANVTLAGPTFFSEVLQTAMARASQPVDQADQRYNVLLILTDGIINDMQQTIDCLVAASNLPLSVVIVGVGNANFSDMSALDGDSGKLRDSVGNMASRDIVQFIPFSKYPPEDTGIRSRLAADTMAEIPGQLLKYFSAQKIRPNPPRPPGPLPSFDHPGSQASTVYEASGAGYDDSPPPYTR